MYTMIRISVVFILSFCVYLAHGLTGPNVCTKAEAYPQQVEVAVKEPFEVRTFAWCARIPPRCRKIKIGYRDVLKNETRIMQRNVEVCCKGYHENGNRCNPVCSNACIHGTCIAPDECECAPGWAGHTCNISCGKDKWGPRCENECKCGTDSRCDPITGKCICSPGVKGDDCIYACECLNGATCNPQVGVCECKPGFIGQFCESTCSLGRYGKNCGQICDCLNGAACSVITGQCFCSPGYFGDRCEIQNCTELGERCSSNHLQLVSTNDVEIKESGHNPATMIVAICLLLVFILMLSLFLILKYKKKLHSLKNELAFVTYVAEKPQDRFANPVYDYQTPKVQTVVMANPVMVDLKNDLSCFKNMEKPLSFDPDFGACGGDTLEELKVKDYNNYNPNIYHNIDDIKNFNKEPLYDEIKSKGNEDDESQYDHLQYDKPRPLVRTNYDYFDGNKPT